ncbi:MAG: hypothetical protein LUD51_05430 [Clostridia bacterium]|nr:hypothetical protein [Clostridia bacterium]
MSEGRKAICYTPGAEAVSEIHNEDTLEAIAEVEEMKANPGMRKSYRDVDEMMGKLLSDS